MRASGTGYFRRPAKSGSGPRRGHNTKSFISTSRLLPGEVTTALGASLEVSSSNGKQEVGSEGPSSSLVAIHVQGAPCF